MANTKAPIPTARNPIKHLVRSITRDLNGIYRPERHYMRGAGPKSANTGESADSQTGAETNRRQLGVTNG